MPRRRREAYSCTSTDDNDGSAPVSAKNTRLLVELRRYQKGVGVATALLLEAGIAVVSQRDFHTLARLRARLDPGYQPPPDARDHHEHPWTLEHLPAPHPRA